MSQSRIQNLVRLQGKLKLTEKEWRYIHTCKFLLYSSAFQCSSHQPISVADVGWSLCHTNLLISSCLKNLWFWVSLWLGVGDAGLPPLPPSCLGYASGDKWFLYSVFLWSNICGPTRNIWQYQHMERIGKHHFLIWEIHKEIEFWNGIKLIGNFKKFHYILINTFHGSTSVSYRR